MGPRTCRTLGICLALSVGILLVASSPAHADHACDALGEPGWSTVPSHEVVNVADGVPYEIDGNWFVDRRTTVLPLCNYINAAGNYSLRSYSLGPEDRTEPVMICKGRAALAPYAGPCPPSNPFGR